MTVLCIQHILSNWQFPSKPQECISVTIITPQGGNFSSFPPVSYMS